MSEMGDILALAGPPDASHNRTPVLARVNIRIEVRDAKTGRVISRQRRHNLAVDAGLTLIRNLMYGDTVAVLSHAAVGTSSTAAAAAQTALVAEVLRGAVIQKTKGTNSLTYRWVVGSQAANGSTLREWGLFNDAAAGTMYARVVADAIVKTIAVSVLATWTLSWASDE